MIKILQFIHGLNMGGAETLVKEYALGLDKKKFEVTVLCCEHRDSPYEKMLAEAGIQVIYICDEMPFFKFRNIGTRIINYFMLFVLIRNYIHEISPAVIHFHLPLSKYVRFAHPKKSTNIVYTQHFNVERWKKNYSSDIAAMKWIIKNYNTRLIALNEDMKKEMEELFNLNTTVVLNNGIDIERFCISKNKKNIRKELGISQNAYVVGHIGRFNCVKNHKFLVEVFNEIYKKNEKSKLLLVGKGETEKEVCKQLKELNLLEHTIILQDRTDIPELLSVMDIFIFPSLSEGLGISLIEAQVVGIKCLASDRVPSATKISNIIKYLSLEETPLVWSEYALTFKMQSSSIIYNDIDKWDMKNIIRELECLYLKMVTEE